MSQTLGLIFEITNFEEQIAIWVAKNQAFDLVL